jgi:adenylate kinase
MRNSTTRSRFLALAGILAGLFVAEAATRPIIVLLGPTGAGKSVQAARLQKAYGFSVISAEELIAYDPSMLARFKQPQIQGVSPRMDPALNKIFLKHLEKIDLGKGLVLDGYPASKDHADFLAKVAQDKGLGKALVIHLMVKDDDARQRMKGRDPQRIEQALKDYHRETDFAKLYYTEADIVEVDGSKKPDEVAKEIRKIVDQRMKQ